MDHQNELLARVIGAQHAQTAAGPLNLGQRDEHNSNSNSSSGSSGGASSSCPSVMQVNNNHPASSANGAIQHVASLAGGAKNKKLFPQKLWDLINDKKYNFCLRWSDDGQLVYLNRDDFEDSYLRTSENQFHTQKAISFVRQMNMYGFRKVDDCYYENDNFKRDCEHLLKNMIRKHSTKGPTLAPRSSSSAKTHGADTLPHFIYAQSTPQLHHNSPASPTTSSLQAASLLAAGHSGTNDLKLGGLSCGPLLSTFNNKTAQQLAQQQFHDNKSMLRSFGSEDMSHIDGTADDSISSSEDYCCSADSSQTDTLVSVLERLDNAGHHPYNSPSSLGSSKERHLNDAISKQFHLSRNLEASPSEEPIMTSHLTLKNNPLPDMALPNNFNKVNNQRAQNDDNVCDQLNSNQTIQQQNYQFICDSQKELIKSWILQQAGNTHLHGDLDTLSRRNHQDTTNDNSNLNAFYSLVSSLNNHLYQPAAQMQSSCQNNLFDLTRLSGIQQLYQQMLTQQLAAAKSEPGACDLASGNRTVLDDKLDLCPPHIEEPISIVTRKSRNQHESVLGGKIRNVFESNHADDNYLINLANDRLAMTNKDGSCQDILTKRRDNKANRSFKRSVDSILDSNNNSSPERSMKKMKVIEHSSEVRGINNQNLKSPAIKYARNLVTQVAIDREAKVDESVLGVASRYTELFVQTLFDTAHVIARHSNGSGSNDSLLANDNFALDGEYNQQHDIGHDQSKINLSDLTSAMKLLPSKLQKMLD